MFKRKRERFPRSPFVVSLLPPQPRRCHTLVLEMENTLFSVRREMLPQDEGSVCLLEVAWEDMYVYQNAWIKSFLKYMALWFEIVLFTRSSKRRAGCFVEKIDRNNQISFKINEETFATKNKQVKYLSVPKCASHPMQSRSNASSVTNPTESSKTSSLHYGV